MKQPKLAAALTILALATPALAADAPKPFVVHYPNIQWFDPVYVADEKGWFAEEGSKIEWVGEIPAAQLVPAVAAGKIDFANRHTPLVLTARAGGAKLKIVADLLVREGKLKQGQIAATDVYSNEFNPFARHASN